MSDDTTEYELKVFRAFQRQVERLRNSSIVRQGKVTIQKTFSIDLATGDRTVSFSGYDPESFQAQLPILRQFVLKRDQISLHKVSNLILRRCQRQELREWATEAKELWNASLRRLPGLNDQTVFGVTVSHESALEKLFYGFGGLFHVDLDQPDEESSGTAIEGALIHSEFPQLWRCLNIVDSVISWWLDDTTSDVPTVEQVRQKSQARPLTNP